MIHINNLMEWNLKKLLGPICDFSKVASYKLNIQKSVTFLIKSYEKSEILKK